MDGCTYVTFCGYESNAVHVYVLDGDLAKMLLDPYTSEPFPLDRDQALFYFWQVLKGVDFLHKNNVLHLDIKGSNILVFDEGRTLKICNFEMAMHVDEVASKAGKHLGTLHFLAPEVSDFSVHS